MITNLKMKTLLLMLTVICKIGFGQAIPTLELTNRLIAPGQGPSLAPVVVPFEVDAVNNSNFSSYTPALNVTVSLRNQKFTGLAYSNVSTGMVFGGAPSLSSDGAIQQVTPYNIFDILGAYNGNGGPTSNMFTSNPTATGSNLGTGFDVTGDAFGNGVNSGVEIFTAAQVLYDQNQAKDGRYEFGELVLTFSRPVKNPVIHLAGLGGSYRYLPFGKQDMPANYLSSYFSSELELQNVGLTSTKLSSNAFLTLTGNNILNNAAKPNGGSVSVSGEQFDNYGAATGSIKINGTVTQLVYKVFLRGSSASDMNFSTKGSNVTCGATTCPHDPFTGDQWFVSASLDKPTQQISGNVYIDKDGLSDNNINQSAGVANATTNVGGTLFANLLNTAGLVVASTTVSSDGSYLFDAVPPNTYTVQLSTISSAGTYASPVVAPAPILPEGWVNTGEFNGNTAGSDGMVNSVSANIVIAPNDIKVNTNFGIERLPESVSVNTTTPTPALNSTISVNALTGSDPEDQTTTGVLTGKTIQITTLPTNSQLLYNGVPVVLNQVITNYDPALLKIKFTTATAASSTQFSFAYVDAAGFADRSPATYTVNWTSAGPLPISLVDFTATKQSKVVDLNWQTSNEQNSSYFDVEFSTDGSKFESIGRVNAAGSSSTLKSYSLVHLSPVNGINYYRLKMVDVDGTFKYSAVRTVKFSTTILITAMPNPTTDRVYITSNEAGVLQSVALFSINGKLLQQLNNFTLGKSIDLSNYPASLYILKLVDKNGNTEVIKVVKK